MPSVRSTLERIRDRFVPPPEGFERLVARRRRRQRNQRLAAATVALGLSAGLVVGLWTVFRTTVPPTPRPAATVTVGVGGSPVDVAIGEGGVWVATVTEPSGRGEVVRIAPSLGEVVSRIPLPEVGALAVGEGGVWVANLRHETVTRIDPETDEVADVIDMPPLPYEVAEGDDAFLPEDVAIGFGRVWVSTARGSVASIDPATGGFIQSTGDPRAILGGVATGAGSVWAWNIFEPPEAEVWRMSPDLAEVDQVSMPAAVLEAAAGSGAAAGSAGLYVLHAETGDVSLVGAANSLRGPVEDAILVGSAGERANTIAVQDPTVYVAAAAGNVYAIDPGSGDATLLARLPGEPTALGVGADALWAALTDGTVMRLALKRETPPEPTATPTPAATGGEPRLFLAGDGELWMVDVAGGAVEHVEVPELSPGDPPHRIVRRDGGLVAWGYDTLVLDPDLRSEPEVLVPNSWIFIPSAAEDRVWVGILDPESPATERALGAVREVTVNGEVTVPDIRPPGGRWPVAAVEEGLVFQRRDSMEVWDPRTGEVIRRLPGLFPLAWQGHRLAWCDEQCEKAHITDFAAGTDREIPLPPGVFAFHEYEGAFSPDGSHLALIGQTDERYVRADFQLVLVDVATGEGKAVEGTVVRSGYNFVDWSAGGDSVFTTGGGVGERRQLIEYRSSGGTGGGHRRRGRGLLRHGGGLSQLDTGPSWP